MRRIERKRILWMTLLASVLCVFFFTQVYATGLTESSLRPQSLQIATGGSLAGELGYQSKSSSSGVSKRLRPIVATIDGVAGVGKTTTARNVAEVLGARYISYGGCYKFLAWLALEAGIKVGPDMKEKDKREVIALARDANFSSLIMPYHDGDKYFYGDKDITQVFFLDQLARSGSFISQIPEVRQAIVSQLKRVVRKEKSQGRSVVLEGRVAGIEIAPDADVKIFLTADLDVRARHRAMGLIENRGLGSVYCELFKVTEGSFKSILDKEGENALKGRIIKAVKTNIQNRDRQDQEREYMPAVKIPGAVTINSTNLTTEEVLQAVVDIIYKAIDTEVVAGKNYLILSKPKGFKPQGPPFSYKHKELLENPLLPEGVADSIRNTWQKIKASCEDKSKALDAIVVSVSREHLKENIREIESLRGRLFHEDTPVIFIFEPRHVSWGTLNCDIYLFTITKRALEKLGLSYDKTKIISILASGKGKRTEFNTHCLGFGCKPLLPLPSGYSTLAGTIIDSYQFLNFSSPKGSPEWAEWIARVGDQFVFALRNPFKDKTEPYITAGLRVPVAEEVKGNLNHPLRMMNAFFKIDETNTRILHSVVGPQGSLDEFIDKTDHAAITTFVRRFKPEAIEAFIKHYTDSNGSPLFVNYGLTGSGHLLGYATSSEGKLRALHRQHPGKIPLEDKLAIQKTAKAFAEEVGLGYADLGHTEKGAKFMDIGRNDVYHQEAFMQVFDDPVLQAYFDVKVEDGNVVVDSELGPDNCYGKSALRGRKRMFLRNVKTLEEPSFRGDETVVLTTVAKNLDLPGECMVAPVEDLTEAVYLDKPRMMLADFWTKDGRKIRLKYSLDRNPKEEKEYTRPQFGPERDIAFADLELLQDKEITRRHHQLSRLPVKEIFSESRVYGQVLSCIPRVDSEGSFKLESQLVTIPDGYSVVCVNLDRTTFKDQLEIHIRILESEVGSFILNNLLRKKLGQTQPRSLTLLDDSEQLQKLYPDMASGHRDSFPLYFKPTYFIAQSLNRFGIVITEEQVMAFVEELPEDLTMNELIKDYDVPESFFIHLKKNFALEAFDVSEHRFKVRSTVRHVISEEGRVERALSALENRDMISFGKIQYEIYESLKDNFRVIDEPTRALVEEVLAPLDYVLGVAPNARGWGGVVFVWVREKDEEKVAKHIKENFFKKQPRYAELSDEELNQRVICAKIGPPADLFIWQDSAKGNNPYIVKVETLKRNLANPDSSDCLRLKKFYGDKNLDIQRERFLTALKHFSKIYPEVEDIVVTRSGGRVLLAGQHYSFNHGSIITAPILNDTLVLMGINPQDASIKLNNMMTDEFAPLSVPGIKQVSISPKAKQDLLWTDYSLATLKYLGLVLNKQGLSLPGLCILVDGRPEYQGVPIRRSFGASSALETSLIIATMGILNAREKLSAAEVTKICIDAENALGFSCGYIDPWSVLRGWLFPRTISTITEQAERGIISREQLLQCALINQAA